MNIIRDFYGDEVEVKDNLNIATYSKANAFFNCPKCGAPFHSMHAQPSSELFENYTREPMAICYECSELEKETRAKRRTKTPDLPYGEPIE